ncbi:hypothetical protein TBK1r_63820 [Stieleria magnilauensis]|uniref:FlgN protein n=2 Tax=Stieleria magnilauensis TaxID=2527963 RepID=A0ABX5XZ87_9BACT|nr:hypothetical protein TBK1r_63820 [Planctomycetes bacterium TBK1r]
MEETKQLPVLEAQLATLKIETEQLVRELIGLCDSAAAKVEARSELRGKRVAEFSDRLQEFGVRLSLSQYSQSPYSTFQSTHPDGWKAFTELATDSTERLLYRKMKGRYELLLDDLANDYPVFLQSP